MWIKLILELVTACFIIFFAIKTISSKHPMQALLSLIFTFVMTAFLFLQLNLEFLSFIFILVYVGALLVLFLFAAMTLNTKKFYADQNGRQHFPFAGSCLVIFFFSYSSARIRFEDDPNKVSDLYTYYRFLLKNEFSSLYDFKITNLLATFFNFYKPNAGNWYVAAVNEGPTTDIEFLGFILYSKYYICLLYTSDAADD